MSKKNKKQPAAFQPISEEQQKAYEKEASEAYGADVMKHSMKLWHSYTDAQKQQIMEEAGQVYTDLIAIMDKGHEHDDVQALLVRWHQNMHYFFDPSFEALRGLGNMYHDDERFNATFTAMHPDLPAFLKSAINVYVDALELEWLERELGLLDA